MKSWARSFYKSKAWRQCRDAFFVYRHGLCERCGGPGKIVHHKVYLTPQNINDPAVSLNHENLELLCQDCHNKEHHETEPVAEGLRFDENGDLIQTAKSDDPNLEYTRRYLAGEILPGSYDWLREREKWRAR